MNNKGGPRYPEYELITSMADPLVERWRGARALSQWILGMPFMNRRIVRNAKTPKHARDMIRIHCQKALQVVRLHVEVTGESPKIGQGCVVTYNESSFLDVLAYGSVMWDHVDRAAAAELYGKLPFAKEACAKAKIELVPRGDRDGTERLMNRMVGAVQAGERLGWGAEGRLTGKDGIARFKIGASLIAIRGGVPLIPVVYCGGHQSMPLGSLRARPGKISVRFGTPISTTGIPEQDARDFAGAAQEIMSHMYEDLRTEWGAL